MKKGDILIELDTESETDITFIKEQISVIEAEIDVYSKLIDKIDISNISLKIIMKIVKVISKLL